MIKIDPLDLRGIHEENARIEILDTINILIEKMNELGLTVRQSRTVVEILEKAVEGSIAMSKVYIEPTVYCNFNGRPKERP